LNQTVDTGIAVGPGRALAQLRSERKLSIADVAQRLKYGARQIEALEAEEFDRLPGATFVRGMVRGYAKLLETDPEPILEALEQRYIPADVDLDLRDKGIPFARRGRHGTRAYLALSVLVLIVVAGVLYEWRVGAFPWVRLGANAPLEQNQPVAGSRPARAAPSEEVAPQAAAPATLPEPPPADAAVRPEAAAAPATAVPPAPPSQAPGGEGRLRMEFGGESWVEIRDKDGKLLMSQLNPTGSRRIVSGRVPLSLVIGNAANVRLTYNDKPVDLKPYIQIEVARLTLN
jgi:cytoskeleton protein RodZ